MARGPSSANQPSFTPEQLQEACHVLACHHAPYVKVQRARIAVALQDNPQASNTELCDMTGAHRSTVQRWRKRWTRHGFALDDAPRSGRPPAFSPLQLAQIKAVACEVPFRLNLPFSRLSLSELQGYVKEQQIVEHLSIGALWNLLNQDAIRPWYHRSWIFPRDPLFVEKAAPELDLYQGQWEERCLRAGEHVVCLDMKSSIQARARCRGSVPPHPGHGQLVEHEYERQGALNLIACLDVHSGQVFGRCYDQRGNQAVRDFLGRAFAREPYASARRIHLVLDNGTSQHPSTFPPWLAQHHDKVPVHYLPVHASWLNQIEIYFSIVQRQGVNTQRLRCSEAVRGTSHGVPDPLQSSGETICVEVHSSGLGRAPELASLKL